MDLDLAHKLLLRPALRQAAFLDDFGGVDKSSLRIDELEALREAALAQKLAFQVPADPDFTIRLFELFFYNCLLRLT